MDYRISRYLGATSREASGASVPPGFGDEKEFSRGRGAATPPVLPYDIACVFVRKYETGGRDCSIHRGWQEELPAR
jgi:hypothetical protein